MAPNTRRIVLAAVVWMLAASVPVFSLWGFTVDDALIPARVAFRLAQGNGYRFNTGGAPVDASTPLGWPYVLMPFAGNGVLAAHRAAKIIGATTWIIGAGGLGALIEKAARSRLRHAPVAVLLVCLPMGAWAASGMETGVVMALGVAALVSHPIGALCAGLAAAFRPELIGWAVVLSCGLSLAERRAEAAPEWRPPWPALIRSIALATAPAVIVAAIRSSVFGHAAPLAAFAKPSDAAHGAFYAAAGLLWLGVPVLVCAPFAFPKLSGRHWTVLVAALAHTLSLIAAGGDWMPYFRLWTPIIPGLLLVAAALIDHSGLPATAIRLGLAVSICVLLDVRHLPSARRIEEQRASLIRETGRLLAGARFPATVDVGWVGAAMDRDVMDLAGVTSVEVALLPGGHTTKQIPPDWLERHHVDSLILLLAPGALAAREYHESHFARIVEGRVALFSRDLAFEAIATVPLLGTDQRYLLLRRKKAP